MVGSTLLQRRGDPEQVDLCASKMVGFCRDCIKNMFLRMSKTLVRMTNFPWQAADHFACIYRARKCRSRNLFRAHLSN